ncbi:MAG: Flp pilus assembly complex ATPase component [Alphaproteobacteria bacterium]|nr:Flp pilus assembly complex ATPase component [Alphaproteobacteria bacterium]NCQ87437.1 Flp pilus assembly complex ATPase component [Alphaproteobacteria bacterium]NCT06308.1 Flp pilus assembly complex ATPase component [Alphaproteobacteria bacterium]
MDDNDTNFDPHSTPLIPVEVASAGQDKEIDVVEGAVQERRGGDRRKKNIGPPFGVERRKATDRRKIRSKEGRERYLDMVHRERAMLLEYGVSRSTEQLLDMAGAISDDGGDQEEGMRYRATGDQLRTILPVQSWLPLSIHLIGLQEGILKIAPLNDLNERQLESLLSAARRSGFHVDEIVSEMWDRAELLDTLRSVHDLSADRCEKTLSMWLSDIDNGLLLNRFLRDMMAESLQMRASDIHLVQDNNPDAPNWIRYRIDGDLIPIHLLPAEAMARLTTLLKRDAGLNFGDRVTPKDGRFGFVWQGRTIDVRVAAGPQAQDGEKITLRLLDRAALKGFDELFRRHETVGDNLANLLSPEIKGGGGLILLSGPTGSGKTTTLYACVQQIDRRRKHVLTIEDPIEYELRYSTQWQVRPGQEGGGFADLIRASMRHDPDYIIIGEMRDSDTVETALRAAESGHTVISTIHADTALQTFERMRSLMPSERERSSTYTLAQQVRAILNQRLVRTLCQGCAHKKILKDVVPPEALKEFGLTGDEKVKTHNSSGCDLCNRTGISGRTLLLDALLITSGPGQRNHIYEALLNNPHDLIGCNDVIVHTRREGLVDLVISGQIDPVSARSYLEE